MRQHRGMERLPVLAACVAFAGPLSASEPLMCPDPLFQVTADTPALVARTCETAARARETLALCNVVLDTPVEIEITENVTGEIGPCLGVYHCGDGRIELLSPDAMRAFRLKDGAFSTISDEAYWESVLLHELTHAAFDHVTCPFEDCVATSEYAAYAMQVYALPPEEQARFGQTVVLRGDVNRSAISAMMYFMSPDRFAKYAWLHFSARPDPCAYMGQIMDGKILFDREPF